MSPSIAARIYTLVGGAAGVQALIGNPARLYPMRAPQGAALPRVVYTIVSEVPINSIGDANTGMTRARVQFDCYARLAADAVTLADAVTTALQSGTAAFAVPAYDIRDVGEDEIESARRIVDAVIHVKE